MNCQICLAAMNFTTYLERPANHEETICPEGGMYLCHYLFIKNEQDEWLFQSMESWIKFISKFLDKNNLYKLFLILTFVIWTKITHQG